MRNFFLKSVLCKQRPVPNNTSKNHKHRFLKDTVPSWYHFYHEINALINRLDCDLPIEASIYRTTPYIFIVYSNFHSANLIMNRFLKTINTEKTHKFKKCTGICREFVRISLKNSLHVFSFANLDFSSALSVKIDQDPPWIKFVSYRVSFRFDFKTKTWFWETS